MKFCQQQEPAHMELARKSEESLMERYVKTCDIILLAYYRASPIIGFVSLILNYIRVFSFRVLYCIFCLSAKIMCIISNFVQIRVWKELDYGSMTDAEKQLLVSEVNLLRELKHPNIVRYHDRIIDKVSTKIYIVMEYCEGGDLGALISKHRKERYHIRCPHIVYNSLVNLL